MSAAGCAKSDLVEAVDRLIPVLWLINVRNAPVAACWDLLEPGERDRSRRYVRDADRHTFVATRAALRCALAELTGIDLRAFRFQLGRWGKPCIASPASPRHFSVSHSGSLSLVAVSSARRFGADIEQRRRVADWHAIAETCLGPSIAVLLDTLDDEVRDDAFQVFWTAAEAFAKATGLGWAGHGGCVPIQAMSVDLATVYFHHAAAPGCTWTAVPIDAGVDHLGTLVLECATGELLRAAALQAEIVDLDDVLSRHFLNVV
jgi:phosphopantetheinyl transferase